MLKMDLSWVFPFYLYILCATYVVGVALKRDMSTQPREDVTSFPPPTLEKRQLFERP